MVLIKFYALAVLITLSLVGPCFSSPGHHVHHRIHVPTKVKTIFHTKIIKIPEHHHYIHEKEKPKLVKIPEHHHYFHDKEKEHPLDFHDFHTKDDEIDIPDEYENDHKGSYGYESHKHNVFKKHAPTRYRKKRKH